ncbi:MAG: conserved phage C-terminal domain-containing protein [Aeromonas jandaei]
MANITLEDFEILLRKIVREEIEAHEIRKNEMKKNDKKVVKEVNNLMLDSAKIIVEYLNERCGSKFNYKSVGHNKPIIARLNQGYTIDDLKRVIDIKSKEWLGSEMAKYLIPSTLFRESKIDGYLNAVQFSEDNTEKQIDINEYD